MNQVLSSKNGARDVCEVVFIDHQKVERVRQALPSLDVFSYLAYTFKALGDPTRVKMLYALSKEELCVCDMAALFGVTRSAISHQLRTLRNLRLVKYRRDGKVVYYSLDDDHVTRFLRDGMDHVREYVLNDQRL
ncbi:MAG TPA: metalloregulator ArsR/SmtB family transcription factor [bacterium]|nr:winged helix-turn-helix transcriptional regulator [Candidatus Omnitrophota bacterium]HOJ61844.1 metalloregulator ArsR/SmtB family transcription factor [bacterium]HOL96549.1 metalloregulator ArsR/SmtB family transcription factor [bacterium]HPP03028.1 metalloregulator ArsR/SmtB family transcription factor [bacterium]